MGVGGVVIIGVVVREASDGVSVQSHLRHGLCPPVDRDQGVPGAAQGQPSHTSPLQRLVEDVLLEVQVGVKDLDPAVARVNNEKVVALVQS